MALAKTEFHINTFLWQPILPKTITVAKQVEAMLKE